MLAVTILTSLEAQELAELGISGTPMEAVVQLGVPGAERGSRRCGGLGARGRRRFGSRAGQNFLIVTPGIRPASSAINDQARIATPASAMAAGADYLVVGRPVTGAPDPVAAADAIVAEMNAARKADSSLRSG